MEIRFVQVKRDRIAWVALLAPQFARAEPHGVEMLRVFVAVRVGVGEDGRAVIEDDNAVCARERSAAGACGPPGYR